MIDRIILYTLFSLNTPTSKDEHPFEINDFIETANNYQIYLAAEADEPLK